MTGVGCLQLKKNDVEKGGESDKWEKRGNGGIKKTMNLPGV